MRKEMMKMKIKSISDIPNAIFNPLKSWAEQSTGNWNILIGVGFLLFIGSAIFAYVFYKKIGQDDERTNKIFLKSSYFMLWAIILCDVIFPKDYMWNIFFLFKYALAILAGGIYMAIQYKKDLS
jgi:membrane-associated HD superfamily phosphohydrolase